MIRAILFSMTFWVCLGLGCATKFPKFQASNPVFDIYIHRFEQNYGHKIDISIAFDKLEGDAVGECWKWDGFHEEIRVDRGWWDMNEDDLAREQLIFHELGHCILDRGHVSARRVWIDGETRAPVSIMYPYVFSDIYHYEIHHDEYVNELFHPSGSYAEDLSKCKGVENE